MTDARRPGSEETTAMRMNLKKRLIVNFTLIGALPLALVGLISYQRARSALTEQAYSSLQSVQAPVAARIEQQFVRHQNELASMIQMMASLRQEGFSRLGVVTTLRAQRVEQLLQTTRDFFRARERNAAVLDVFRRVKAYHDAMNTAADGPLDTSSPEFAAITQSESAQRVRDLGAQAGYVDLYVICRAHGHVLFSTAGRSDVGQNLGAGDLRESPLAEAWRQVVDTDQVSISDIGPYAPAGGQQAMFMAGPVRDETGSTVAILACQLSFDPINAVVQSRDGMGRTGESYLIGERGGRMGFRSTMLTMGDGQYVPGYDFTDRAPAPWRQALAGETGVELVQGSDGRIVSYAYRPLEVEGLHWGIISRMDVEETIVPTVEGHEKDVLAEFVETFGYYDAFLIAPDGLCFYTVAREADYNTNFVNGEFRDSSMGRLVQRVIETHQPGIADMAPYAASNDAPSMFIAAPILRGDELELIAGLQLSNEEITATAAQREGMGETGQTMLVGPDMLLRSDPPLDTDLTVQSSFADNDQIDNRAVQSALAGETGVGLLPGLDGNTHLMAWKPIEIGDGITWACVSEIEKNEVLAPVMRLGQIIGALGLLMAAGVSCLGWVTGRKVANPVIKIIDELGKGSEEVAAASVQVAAASQSVAEGSTEQAASLEEVSASLEEMSSMVKQSADNAQQVSDLTGTTQQLIGSGEQSMRQMVTSMAEIREASSKITSVLKIIEEIAFQVNLLALNAAVEAARAGEHGKGFAVVADEVRSLAMRASEAVKTTGEVITTAVHSSERGSKIVEETAKVFSEIATSSAKVASLSAEVNTASREQASGIGQIAEAVSQIDQVTQANSTASEEAASASEEASAQARVMRDSVARLAEIVLAVEAHAAQVQQVAEEAAGPRASNSKGARLPAQPPNGNGAAKGRMTKAHRVPSSAPKPAEQVDLSNIEF